MSISTRVADIDIKFETQELLTSILIKNFVIIKEMQVEFCPGLNVFTGETGGGKSLLLDAVELLLGKRASTDIIRKGHDEAVIEGSFWFEKHSSLMRAMQDIGISGECYTLRRIISQTPWKNRFFINDTSVNLSTISSLRHLFVEVHGQFTHFNFLQSENHITILDSFSDTGRELKEYRLAFYDYEKLKKELSQLNVKNSESERQYLSFLYEKIQDCDISSGEYEELEQERDIILNAQELSDSGEDIYDKIYACEGSAAERIDEAAKQLDTMLKVDGSLHDAAELLENISIMIHEFSDTIRSYKETVQYDPDRLEEIESRLGTINDLKKQCGNSINDIFIKREQLKEQIEELDETEGRILDIQNKITQQEKALEKLAAKISSKRLGACDKFKKKIEKELARLMMPEANLKVEIKQRLRNKKIILNENGMDDVTFFISTNPGEGMGELSEIASGGERSRLTLAIKTILKETSEASAVFDEIDTGISGEAAKSVGKKLKDISQNSQIFCITHLPQIAALASAHFLVKKESIGERTISSTVLLDKSQRVYELARLLNGADPTETTLQHAQEIHDAAHQQDSA